MASSHTPTTWYGTQAHTRHYMASSHTPIMWFHWHFGRCCMQDAGRNALTGWGTRTMLTWPLRQPAAFTSTCSAQKTTLGLTMRRQAFWWPTACREGEGRTGRGAEEQGSDGLNLEQEL